MSAAALGTLVGLGVLVGIIFLIVWTIRKVTSNKKTRKRR